MTPGEVLFGKFEMVEVINTHDFTIDSGVLKLN